MLQRTAADDKGDDDTTEDESPYRELLLAAGPQLDSDD